MNLWKQIPAGDNPPTDLNMVIEVLSGSRDKYEYRSDWEAFVLDRIIPSAVFFPVDYGFVPQTWSEDNDPLDIMTLTHEPLEVGAIARVRVIGALHIEDEHGPDGKILSVLADDARFKGYNDITDVHEHQLTQIQEFFTTYKRLEPHKWTNIKGWQGAKEAKQIVETAIQRFNTCFKT
ncbi:MAG: inorganic diphosphatase [Nitrososphaerota archaeon]|jgi:inorganic pyrophosphatase|nr:inorganic diphosphatase [Nitrososphaerota archaeon]